jgi:uncharacterized protein YfbU (UPF0304 family)
MQNAYRIQLSSLIYKQKIKLKKIMSKLKTTTAEELKRLQQKRNEVNTALQQLSMVKEWDDWAFGYDIADPKTISPSFEKMEYSENLLVQFPTSNFLGSEGFLGITEDNRPVYEINTRIDELIRKSYEVETELTYLNSEERRRIWATFLKHYYNNPNIVFVTSSKIFDSVFENEKRRLSNILSFYNAEIDEMIDIIICEDERQQYEDVCEEEEEKYMGHFQILESSRQYYRKQDLNTKHPIYNIS